MRDVFVDSSVLLLAVGPEHPRRDPCRAVVASAASGHVRLHLSVEGGQEFLFHRLRRCDREAAIADFDRVDALVRWHAFTEEVLALSRDLVRDGHARGRDAVHAATALLAGFEQMVSCDADFDGIPGLVRLDPALGWFGG